MWYIRDASLLAVCLLVGGIYACWNMISLIAPTNKTLQYLQLHLYVQLGITFSKLSTDTPGE